MRDSRIGSYGGIAVGLSLLWRYILLGRLLDGRFAGYFVAAHLLCRWTTLPLSYALPAARTDGSGVTIAQLASKMALAMDSILTGAGVIGFLRHPAWLPVP